MGNPSTAANQRTFSMFYIASILYSHPFLFRGEEERKKGKEDGERSRRNEAGEEDMERARRRIGRWRDG